MRRFCQLIGLAISGTVLAERVRGVIAHQAQIFPHCPVSFASNAGSRAQRTLFPGIIHVAPRAGWKALIFLCLKKVPNTELPPTRT